MPVIKANRPTVILPCKSRGDLITHVQMTLYPRAMLLQYGTFDEHQKFSVEICEVLPLAMIPPLLIASEDARRIPSGDHRFEELAEAG